jgi:hypothetical protein
VAVEREYEGEPALFGYRVKDPARQPLGRLTDTIRTAATAPLAEVKQFAQVLRFARLPGLLRRALWWLGLNIGRVRAKQFGTFGVSAYGGLGAESLHPITVLTTLVNYGVIGPDGSVDVRIVYDHRVMDGATVARVLVALEKCLNETIVAELKDSAVRQAA